MKLLIPQIGSKIVLRKPWTFTVWSERRNETLGKTLGILALRKTGPWPQSDFGGQRVPPRYVDQWLWNGQKDPTPQDRYTRFDVVASSACTLPKGITLTVDRIYIRNGAKDFSSISFRLNIDPKKPLKFVGTDIVIPKGIRFWAKLDECNNIEFDPLPDND